MLQVSVSLQYPLEVVGCWKSFWWLWLHMWTLHPGLANHSAPFLLSWCKEIGPGVDIAVTRIIHVIVFNKIQYRKLTEEEGKARKEMRGEEKQKNRKKKKGREKERKREDKSCLPNMKSWKNIESKGLPGPFFCPYRLNKANKNKLKTERNKEWEKRKKSENYYHTEFLITLPNILFFFFWSVSF